MTIASLCLPKGAILAPMAGVTDMPFRLLCQKQGCALSYTEMVSVRGMHHMKVLPEVVERLLEMHSDEQNVGVQLFGNEPEFFEEAIVRLEGRRFALVDINMGCPAVKIVSNGDGAALLKNLPLASRIVEASVRAAKVPVTLKIRLGWDEDAICVKDYAQMAEACGAAAVTVHGRTREMFYSGHADWDAIAAVKKHVRIPVIGNGDVTSGADALRMFEHTGCDGVMIGRAAQGNPWIFREALDVLEGHPVHVPNVAERMQTALSHLRGMLSYKGERQGVMEMRKHLAWYVKGLRSSTAIRRELMQAHDADTLENLLKSIAERTENEPETH